jgi:DNA-binding Lrp family transcriptional regulator
MIILKGAERAVYEEIQRAVRAGEEPSIEDIADMTGYSESAVKMAVNNLDTREFIRAYRPGIGHKYSYQILQPS